MKLWAYACPQCESYFIQLHGAMLASGVLQVACSACGNVEKINSNNGGAFLATGT